MILPIVVSIISNSQPLLFNEHVPDNPSTFDDQDPELSASSLFFNLPLTTNSTGISPLRSGPDNLDTHKEVEFSFAPAPGIDEYNITIKPRMTPILTGQSTIDEYVLGSKLLQPYSTIAESNGKYYVIFRYNESSNYDFYLMESLTGSQWRNKTKLNFTNLDDHSKPRLMIDNSSDPDAWYLSYNNYSSLFVARSIDYGSSWNTHEIVTIPNIIDDHDITMNNSKHFFICWSEVTGALRSDPVYCSNGTDWNSWNTPFMIDSIYGTCSGLSYSGGVTIANDPINNDTYVVYKNASLVNLAYSGDGWNAITTLLTESDNRLDYGISACFNNFTNMFLTFMHYGDLHILNQSGSPIAPWVYDADEPYLAEAYSLGRGGSPQLTLMETGDYPRVVYSTSQFGTTYDLFSIAGNGMIMNISGGAIGAGQEEVVTWNATDYEGNMVRDDDYNAEVTIYWASVNATSSTTITVDNTKPTLINSNPELNYFSPFSSTGIQDQHDFIFEPSEDVNYWIKIKNDSGPNTNFLTNYSHVATSDSPVYPDYSADFAIDEENRLWMVFISKQNLKSGVWLKYSDDFGNTWSAPESLIEDDLKEFEDTSIAIFEDYIYITYKEKGNLVYFIRSEDRGNSWITTLPDVSSDFPQKGELVVSKNGTLYMLMYQKEFGFSKLQLHYSTDHGDSWMYNNVPQIFAQGTTLFGYDIVVNSTGAVYIAVSNHTNGYTYVSILSTINEGADWTIVKEFNQTTRQFAVTMKLLPEYYAAEGWKDVIYLSYSDINITESRHNYVLLKSEDLGNNWALLANETDYYNQGHNSDLQPFRVANETFLIIAYEENDTTDDIYIRRYGNTHAILSGITAGNYQKSVTWMGKDYFQTNVEDGTYRVEYYVQDGSGLIDQYVNEKIIVDNINPIVLNNTPYSFYYSKAPYTTLNGTERLDMVDASNYTLEVRVNASDTALANMTIHYFTPNENIINMTNSGTYWNGTIPAGASDTVTFSVIVFDKAGNSNTWNDNGTDYSYRAPTITFIPLDILVQDDLNEINKVKENGIINISLVILQDVEFIENVTLHYSIDGGDWETIIFQYDLNYNRFYIYFSELEGHLTIEFYVSYFDMSNTEYNVSTGTNALSIVPTFPVVTNNITAIFIIILGSAIVGTIMIGFHSRSAKGHQKKVEDSINQRTKEIFTQKKKKMNDDETLIKELTSILPEEFKFLNKNYLVSLFGFFGMLSCAILVENSLGIFEITLFVYIGAMLMSLVLFIYWMQRDVSLSIKNEKLSTKNIVFGTIHVIIFMIVTFWMLSRGGNIGWFKYHILDQGGQPPLVFMGFEIYAVYLKVAITYLSSLFVVYLTVVLEMRKNIIDIKKIHEKKANIYVTLYQKEEYINRINQRIYVKVIIFLFLIGIAVIPFTEAGFETLVIGIYLVVPFALIVGIYASIRLLGEVFNKKVMVPKFIVDKVKKCDSCNKEVLAESKFCLHCGTKLIHEEIYIEETMNCSKCNAVIPKNSSYCDDCGNKNTEILSLNK